ncbi:hypothetical protein PPACK8108_LOCUS19843 [Phakopsora pachyrhizi]|uniref:Uncharacterized protein n=1 Tax=Phakopsora pachyrhizi TaxID=170000 RepID=A0AAV0BDJ4_PHAPC|nr:hypothetical protein PPACK8108_LOCUS19843 [Phakopsora pachyrhizi]
MALKLIETPQGRSPKCNGILHVLSLQDKAWSASPKPQELKDKFISEFDPDDPALRIFDLKDFISKVDPNIQLHNRACLEELQDTARAMINTRGCSSQRRSTSPACSGLRSRSTSPPLQSIKNFDPYSSRVQKADLREAIFQIDPNCHIPSNIWLAELRDIAYIMIHPYARLPHSQKRSFETNCNCKLVFFGMVKASNNKFFQTGAASPACSALRSRSASPHLQSIKDFDPYSPNVHMADLQEVMFQINPNCHIPSNIWLAELRDMAYSMIHPQTSLPHSPKRSRPVTPLLQSIKDFDPYSPNVHMADLREVMFQIDPNCHIPSNIWLAELRNMAYSMIHPNPSLHKKADVQVSDLMDYIYTINPSYHIPSGISVAKLCDLAFRLNPHSFHLPCTSKVGDKTSHFEHDGESDESDLDESKSDETEDLKISTNVNRCGLIKVQPQSKILQKRKASSQNEEQNFKESINSDSSSNTPTYYCKRKPYLNGVFIPHNVEFMTEVDGLEYGSTPSDESSSKLFPHKKSKCNQKGLSKSRQPDGLKSACKIPADLVDLTGASQDSLGPSISDPLGYPSKALSGLTGSYTAPSSTGKVPSLPLDYIISQRPPAPPQPLKPPALRQAPLRQSSKASTSHCFQAVVDENAPDVPAYGSTPSDESLSKSFPHDKLKSNQGDSSNTKQPDGLKSASKSPTDLIDLTGAKWDSLGTSISNPSGNPSIPLSGLTGSYPALSSTGKVPSLPLDSVISQRPPALPRPLKPPALCQTTLRQASEASATKSLQPFNESCKTNSANTIIGQGSTLIETSSLPNHQPPTVIPIKATSNQFSSATPEKLVSNKNKHSLFENTIIHLKSQKYKCQIASLPRNENPPYASLDSLSIALCKPVSFGNLTNQGRQRKSSNETSENADSNNNSSNVSVWPSFETQKPKLDYEITDLLHMTAKKSKSRSTVLNSKRILVDKKNTISYSNNPWVDDAVSNSKQNLESELQLDKSEFKAAIRSASEPSNKTQSPAQKHCRHSSHNYTSFTASSGTSMTNPVSPGVSPAKPISRRQQPIGQSKFQESSTKQQAKSTSCQLEHTPVSEKLHSRSAEEFINPSKTSTAKDILSTTSLLSFDANQPIASHPLAVIESLERCKLEHTKHPKTIGDGDKN